MVSGLASLRLEEVEGVESEKLLVTCEQMDAVARVACGTQNVAEVDQRVGAECFFSSQKSFVKMIFELVMRSLMLISIIL